ncbi:MAG: VOC family protein [Burkholderiaceae bacterium]
MKQIYVNIPVASVAKSREFFAALGFSFNEQFSDAQAACMVVEENICVMMLDRQYFQTFTHKPVADATKGTEVLLCLSCESPAAVDDLVAKAIAAGGASPNPKQELGFMYGHGFEDLDGHVWELNWMDPKGMPQ